MLTLIVISCFALCLVCVVCRNIRREKKEKRDNEMYAMILSKGLNRDIISDLEKMIGRIENLSGKVEVSDKFTIEEKEAHLEFFKTTKSRAKDYIKTLELSLDADHGSVPIALFRSAEKEISKISMLLE